ncbi:hypothetical protein NDU88_011060 [Pleurodeles waltl]|uniref:Uncharacterized protein n=1 Tax=Pleurodeles waltl TaxID=8319 RepID=A0AAV7R218_PLEWA|nr:hypothetical protein NDU88_011060 [Pleurodeles waltl]
MTFSGEGQNVCSQFAYRMVFKPSKANDIHEVCIKGGETNLSPNWLQFTLFRSKPIGQRPINAGEGAKDGFSRHRGDGPCYPHQLLRSPRMREPQTCCHQKLMAR